MFLRKGSHKGKQQQQHKSSSSLKGPMVVNRITQEQQGANILQDTGEGVEVSFDQQSSALSAASSTGSISSSVTRSSKSHSKKNQLSEESSSKVSMLPQQLWDRQQKVFKAQYSTRFPALRSDDVSVEQLQAQVAQWKPNPKHRVPLLSSSLSSSSSNQRGSKHAQQQQQQPSFHTALTLLQNFHTTSETAAVREELRQMDQELQALQTDRDWIEATQTKWQQVSSSSSPSKKVSSTKASSSKSLLLEWDVNRLLSSLSSSSKDEDVKQQINQLQLQRGVCFTVQLSSNPTTRDAFLTKCCGYKASSTFSKLLSKNKTQTKTTTALGSAVTVSPDTCQSSSTSMGNPRTIRHVSLLEGVGKYTPSLFVSRDDDDSSKSGSFVHGRLPPHLDQRLQNHQKKDSDIRYLSCGPLGSYYCELQSGQVWWGTACGADDDEFHSIVQQWNVHRVFFGPIHSTVYDDNDKHNSPRTRSSSSWIIVSRQGQVAWKNIPARLHNHLERRLAHGAAPAEVMLGQHGSYFCRFLDGTVDYCLPATMAKVCEHIEAHGGHITSLVVPPSSTIQGVEEPSFIIRHTELKR